MKLFFLLAGCISLLSMRAEAGCVCPDLKTLETGNLMVKGAGVSDQLWTLEHDAVRLELSVDAEGPFEVMLDTFSAAPNEYDRVRANSQGPFRSHAKAQLLGKARAEVKERFFEAKDAAGRVVGKAEWKVTPAEGGPMTLLFSWGLPVAGDDGMPLTTVAFRERYCIDKNAEGAFKKIDGYHTVALKLSAQSIDPIRVRVNRPTGVPVSLCADKLGKTSSGFEIYGRKNLKDVKGVLPVLFGQQI